MYISPPPPHFLLLHFLYLVFSCIWELQISLPPPISPFFGCWCQLHFSTAINMKNKRCYQTCETRSVETEIPCGGALTFNIQNPQEVLGWELEMRDYPRHSTVINDSVSRWVELGDILKRWNSHKTVPINHISLSEQWAKVDQKHSCLLTRRVLTTKPNQLAEKRRRKDFICCTLKKRKSNDHQSLYSTIW